MHTGLRSIITEFALALLSHRDNTYYACGTAIVVAPYLAMTARHVVEDYWFESLQLHESHSSGSFSLLAFQGLDEGADAL
jgi:hypothetical protein